MNNKIIPRIVGGIGNQLFCYAAARRLALVNNAELVIDHKTGFVRDFTYKRQYQLDHFNIPCRKATYFELLFPFSRLRRHRLRVINSKREFIKRNYIQQDGIAFEPRLLQVKTNRTVYLEGYWQSENYFKDVETTIRADLRINPPSDSTNKNMLLRIRNNLSVAVHVRFFEVPNTKQYYNTPVEYYALAIGQMDAFVKDAHYFLFSDQPAAARALIPLPDSRVTCVSHNAGNDENAYADLWLMSQCNHFITANSTFSWWGAWLGGDKEKIVITPALKIEGRDGMTVWGFDGLIPPEWIKV